MNVFANFDKIPSMTLQDIKETKRHGHFRSFVWTDRQRENSTPPPQTQFAGGIKSSAGILQVKTSSPKGNDHSPDSKSSKLVLK